jgi:thiazole synthase ThiGH ThiG subunit
VKRPKRTRPLTGLALRRANRSEARQSILDAANAHRLRLNPNAHPWGRRHIQQAVFVVRQSRLVAPKVLAAAGFRPTGR